MTAADDRAPSRSNDPTDADSTHAETPHSVGDHARRIGHDATKLVSDLQRTAADLDSYLTDRVRQRPLATLSVAAGVGYVIGGGLATRLTVVLLGVATRVATAVAMRELTAQFHAQFQAQDVRPSPSTNATNA